MRLRGRPYLHVLTALVGIALALALVGIVGSSDETDEEKAVRRENVLRRVTPVDDPPSDLKTSGTILAWAPGGLPEAAKSVALQPGVRTLSLVDTRLMWLTRSTGADGRVLDLPAPGYAIPLEVALIDDPHDFAVFVAPSERQAVLSLGPGEALLSRSSAEIRRAERGARLHFGRETVEVVGELSDVSAGGYEAVMLRPRRVPPNRSFLLARLAGQAARERVARALKELLGPGRPLRVRDEGETPFLRYGDAVPPQLVLKAVFGEFSARALPAGGIEIDESWRKQNIRGFRVPIIGRVVCHRGVARGLRGALRTLTDQGRASLIDPDQYGGCFAARFINRDPTNFLSHHSWGVAIDINVRDNPFGSDGVQDPRVIEVMEANGFSWGGRWLIPDPMHFEWSELLTKTP